MTPSSSHKPGVKFAFRLAVVIAILLLVPSAARAGQFTLLPSLTMLGEWTDNLLLTPEESDDPILSDFSVSAIPGAAIHYDSYRSQAYISFAAAFKHYFEYDRYDGWPEYYQGGLGYSYWVNPSLRVSLVDELIYYTDPRDQPFGIENAVEALRTETIGNRIYASAVYNASRLATLEGGYSFTTTEFREPNAQDTVEHFITLNWNQQLSATHRLFVFYNYRRALFSEHYDFLRRLWDDRYSMRPAFPTALSGPEDFDTHVPGVGLGYNATPSLSFEMRSGIILAARNENDIYQLSDLDWYQRVQVSKLFWRMQATAAYTRDLAPAHGLAGAVLTQTVSGRLDERWTSHLESAQETAYTNYLQEAVNIDAWNTGVAVNYYFFNWLGTGLSYSYLQQVSHLPEPAPAQHLYANRITLRLSLATPRPDWLRF